MRCALLKQLCQNVSEMRNLLRAQTKHPRILSFEWAGEQESGSKITLYLVTEPVTPLPTLMDEIQLSGTQRSSYISLGLRQVAEAVAFLGQCKLIHGNVCWQSILVTGDLDWRLGFFDVSTDHASLGSSILMRHGSRVHACNSRCTASQPPLSTVCGTILQGPKLRGLSSCTQPALTLAPLTQHSLYRNSQAMAGHYRPGELDKGQFDGPVWAVDAWGVGCLVQEVFSGSCLRGKEHLRETGSIPAEVLADYKALLHSVPAKRLNPAKVRFGLRTHARLRGGVDAFMPCIQLPCRAQPAALRTTHACHAAAGQRLPPK
jgi:SCY1-like protein 1